MMSPPGQILFPLTKKKKKKKPKNSTSKGPVMSVHGGAEKVGGKTLLKMSDVSDVDKYFSVKGDVRVSDVVGIFEKDSDGKYFQVNTDGSKTELKKKKITLSDCLACSGCTTTAESILVNSQTVSNFLKEAKDKSLFVSISQESVSSLGNFYGISNNSEVFAKLVTFFKLHLKAKAVLHINNAILLPQLCEEFVTRFTKGQSTLISSSCPGFVCYIEKTHGEFMLPYLSKLKSSQAMMGSIVKKVLYKKYVKNVKDVFHVAVAPCYDKKLEASRDDFKDKGINDTDVALTSSELLQLFDEMKVSFKDLNPSTLENTFYCDTEINYSDVVLKYAAWKLHNIKIDKVVFKKGRNSDFHTCCVKVDGKKVLNFAVVNGFRNIQTIIRKLKMKKCPYHFVEVYACPKACLNGGGQIVPSKIENPMNFFERLTLLAKKKTIVKIPQFLEEMRNLNFSTQFHNRKMDEEIEKGKISTSKLDW